MLRGSIACLLALFTAPFVLASGEWVGQIVCSECWHEADRDEVAYGTAENLTCAEECAERGVPLALSIREDDGYALLRLDGGAPEEGLVGRYVRVRGEVKRRSGDRILTIDELERLDESPWPWVPAIAETDLYWTDLGGHVQGLDNYFGRIVVLNFWATWCGPCRKEMPDLVEIQERFGMYGVQVLGASADAPDAIDAVVEFAREQRISFPILMGASIDQMEGLGLGSALPATAVLDRHGHVVERIEGVVKPRELEALLERLVFEEADGHGDEHADDHDHDHAHGHRHERRRRAGLDPTGSRIHASLVPS